MSELYDTKELPKVNFPFTFKTIDWYQRKYPVITEKINVKTIKEFIFVGVVILLNL